MLLQFKVSDPNSCLAVISIDVMALQELVNENNIDKK